MFQNLSTLITLTDRWYIGLLNIIAKLQKKFNWYLLTDFTIVPSVWSTTREKPK